MLQSGEIFDSDYRIERQLGSGGMGNVFLATELETGRCVALKFIDSASLQAPQIENRFLREFKTLGKIAHPNVVSFYNFSKSRDSVYYAVFEYIEGETLRSVLERETSLPWKRAVAIAIQVSCALECMHDAGVIHRDLKPENIMVQRTGDVDRIKLVDFGLAVLQDEHKVDNLTLSGQIIGTVNYLSPEQCLSKPAQGCSDIYSLACTLFEMICGETLFVTNNPSAAIYAHVHEDPSMRLTHFNSRYPLALENLLRRMLAKEGADRPSAAEVQDKLSAMLEGEDTRVIARQNTRIKSIANTRSVLLVLLAAGITGGAILLKRHQEEVPFSKSSAINVDSIANSLHSYEAISYCLKTKPESAHRAILNAWLSRATSRSELKPQQLAWVLNGAAQLETPFDREKSERLYREALKVSTVPDVESDKVMAHQGVASLRGLSIIATAVEDKKQYARKCFDLVCQKWRTSRLDFELCSVLSLMNGLGMPIENAAFLSFLQKHYAYRADYTVCFGDQELICERSVKALEDYHKALQLILDASRIADPHLQHLAKRGIQSFLGKQKPLSGEIKDALRTAVPPILDRLFFLDGAQGKPVFERTMRSVTGLRTSGYKFPPDYWVRLSLIAAKAELFDLAIECINEALESKTDENLRCRNQTLKAVYLIEAGQVKAALRLLSRVDDSVGSPNIIYLARVASSLWRRNMNAEAESLWKRAQLQIDRYGAEDQIQYLSQWGQAMAESNQSERAKETWTRAADLCVNERSGEYKKVLLEDERSRSEEWLTNCLEERICENGVRVSSAMAAAGRLSEALATLDQLCGDDVDKPRLDRVRARTLEAFVEQKLMIGDIAHALPAIQRAYVLRSRSPVENAYAFDLDLRDLVRCKLLMEACIERGSHNAIPVVSGAQPR